MRIIKRTHPVNQSVLYVVQDEVWNGAAAYQNSIVPSKVYGKTFADINSFTTLESAEEFAYKYQNSLQPGEEIVSKY